jgi:Tol biopolymer transport system component/DNA-binding winged helix-turn-helix (wHTH) protein
MQGKLVYEFGPFRFDPRERLLSRNEQSVGLSPQLFDLLLFFVENAGHLLSKEELRNEIWGQAHVSEDTLKVAVGNLRRALGKGQNGLQWIENVRGGGYRFVAGVVRVTEVSATNGNAATDEGPSDGRIQPVKPWARYRIPVVISVLTVLAVSLAVLLFMPAPRLRAAYYTPLTNDIQDKTGPLFTDGVRVYFFEKGSNLTTLAAVAVAGGGKGPIPAPSGNVTIYDLSPSRSELLVDRLRSDQESGLWITSLLDSPPKRISDHRVTAASWSPDGQHVAFIQSKNLYIVGTDGSGARKIAEIPGETMLLRWSPDGQALSFTENEYRNGEVWESIWQIGADGSNRHRLLEGWNNPPHECCGSWAPDGKFFIFQSTRNGRTDLWALSSRPGFLRGLLGSNGEAPVRLSSGLQGFLFPVVNPNGKQVFAVGIEKRGELVRYDSELQNFVPFLGGISATWVSFSKSGQSVAYINYSDQTLWRANSDGSRKTQITFSPLQVDGFSWSPDEKWFALRARTPGVPWMIHLIPTQGGDARLLMPSDTEQGVPTWSADGKSIAFSDVPPIFGKSSGAEVIHLLDVKTHKLSELPGSRGLWTARWSPNGTSLAALTIDGQRLLLYDVGTKKWRPTKAEHVNNPTWSHDAKYIYFDTEGDNRALCRVRVADGHVDQLTSLRAYPNLAWWWSGVTPANSPLILRNLGTNEIYSLMLEFR